MNDIPSAARARLKGTASASGPLHVDPNLLTAFAEQTLLAGERRVVVTHLSQCRDCRDVLSLALPLQQPELQTVGGLAVQPLRWWNLAAVRWSAVAATAAVVIGAVVMRTPQPQLPMAHIQAPAQVQQNIAPASPNESSRAVGTLAEAKPAAAASTSSVLAKQRRTGSKDSTAEGLVLADSQKTAAPKTMDLMTAYRQDEPTSQSREQDEKKLAAAVNTDAVVAAPGSEAANKLQASGVASRAEGASGEIQPRTEQTKPSFTIGESIVQNAPWWTASNGRLLRSLDGGANWEPISVDSRFAVKTYWFFDSDIWAGGEAGALYCSNNRGETWRRVRPALRDGTRLKADISGLDFQDAQHGTVITANGEKWVTADGGVSWKLQ